MKAVCLNTEEIATEDFDIRDSSAMFSYNLTRQFGVTIPHELCIFRFHVLIQNATCQDSTQVPLGYAFHLFGFKALKVGEHMIQHIGKKITFSARFLGSHTLLELHLLY